jgi:hypothetical protein
MDSIHLLVTSITLEFHVQLLAFEGQAIPNERGAM